MKKPSLHLVVSDGAARPARLSARVFGTFQLATLDGDPVAIPNIRARAILALLCADVGNPIERELLCDLFWAGRFRAHAKASLRQCLFEQGKFLETWGGNVLIVTRNTVALDRETVRTDLDELEQALRDADHAAAATRGFRTEASKQPALQPVAHH
ncbi:MAG: hypothetical protein KGM49_01585 [Sphingomonadales bacterium]|nr:hypothetical protein [Sphingomonadales bacterium]